MVKGHGQDYIFLFNKLLEWVIYFHFNIFTTFISKLFFAFVLYISAVCIYIYILGGGEGCNGTCWKIDVTK